MIRVFVIAQSLVTQTGLVALLSTDLDIAGSAIRPASISFAIADSEATVILLEQDAMPIMQTGVPLDLSEVEIPIVLLLEESATISDYLQAGIRSILPSDVSRDHLVEAIKATSAGLIVLHPDWLGSLFMPTVRSSAPLTSREIEVLRMLAEGRGNKAIAQHLNLSEHTIKFHISSIFSKLNVSSRTEAVILGAKQGWVLL